MGYSRTSLTIALCLFATLLACGARKGMAREPVPAQAEIELDCPLEQIQSARLERTVAVVVGCGREAVYVKSCRTCGNDRPSDDCDCVWELQGRVRRSEEVVASRERRLPAPAPAPSVDAGNVALPVEPVPSSEAPVAPTPAPAEEPGEDENGWY